MPQSYPSNRKNYRTMDIDWLQYEMTSFLQELSNLLGPRDEAYFLDGIEISADYDDPHVAIATDNTAVQVRLPNFACGTPCSTILFHLAHECVHLLDPSSSSNVTVLEEGLATWYAFCGSDRLRRRASFCIADNDRSRPYVRAKQLVVEALPYGILSAIKTLRTENRIPIHRIRSRHLRSILPVQVRQETLDELTSRWSDPGRNPDPPL